MTASQTAAASDSAVLTHADDQTASPAEPLADAARTSSWIQRRLQSAIVFYQRAREGRPSPCRFFPSCSAYALESLEVHGTWRGGWLTVRRLLRCRPLGPSGYDPVPERHPSPDHPADQPTAGSPAHSTDSPPTAASSHDAHCSAHSPAPKGG